MDMCFGMSNTFGVRLNGKDMIGKLMKYMTRVVLSTSFNALGFGEVVLKC